MNFTVSATAMTQRTLDKLAQAGKIFTDARKAGLTTACLIFQAKAKEEAPVDTTNLRKNIKYEVNAGADEAKVFVDEKIEYARFQEEGTGLYGPKHAFIYPKKAKFLSWVGKDGKRVFARRSSGTRPKEFFKKGAEELKSKTKIVDAAIYNKMKEGLEL
jgi:HK97 gp10 family phage protein